MRRGAGRELGQVHASGFPGAPLLEQPVLQSDALAGAAAPAGIVAPAFAAARRRPA